MIVDRMTKSTNVLPIKTTHSAKNYAKLYIQEVVRLHGVPVLIISDRGAQLLHNSGSLSRKVWVQR